MLLDCGVAEDSWEYLRLQGDPTSPFWSKSTLNTHGKDWCWIWSSNTLAIWCKKLTHWKIPWKIPWFWERLKAEGEEGDRGWNGWMVSLIQWKLTWVNADRWWRSGSPGALKSLGLQKVRLDLEAEQQQPDILKEIYEKQIKIKEIYEYLF